MDKNELIKIYGTDYKNMTMRLLEAAGLASLIKDPSLRIAIKPNLVNPTPASFGATTHPEIVSGIIEYLQQKGFENIVIAEGAWIGDRTSEAFEYCGYNALSERYGVPLIDTQKEKSFTKDCAGEKLSLCAFLKDVDFLINVPVLKGHSQTGITCALKNLKGIIPNSEKRRFHAMGLHRPIAHLNGGVRQDFIVIDHICGDPEIEDGGHPLTTNCIMAALDPVLTDAYVCSILDCQPALAAYVGLAADLGVGTDDLSTLKVTVLEGTDREGAEYDEVGNESAGNESIPRNFRRISVGSSVTDIDSCSACYTNLCEALDRLAAEGRLEHFEEKICIGQGYKKKNGKIGVGSCTSRFEHTLKGCPPKAEEIYRFLDRIIG